jgi:hypothetical protein
MRRAYASLARAPPRPTCRAASSPTIEKVETHVELDEALFKVK